MTTSALVYGNAPRCLRLASALAAVPLVAACGWAGAAVPEPPASIHDDPARATAVAVAQSLAAAGLDVRSVVACRPPAPAPSGHPRPRAAAFDDGNVATDDPRHVVREGGVVEVPGSPRAVRERVRELEEQTLAAQENGFDEGGHSLHPERRIARGGVLLRLSGDLSPAEVAAYRNALRGLVPAEGIPDLTPTSPLEEAPCST
jgi:hypothetical protein